MNYPVALPECYNSYQDDFTPSHCYMVDEQSSDSDLFSSNNLLSQLDAFNNHYEMEPVGNSSVTSPMQTSISQYNNMNSKQNQDLNKSIKNYRRQNAIAPYDEKYQPDNFTQVNMMLEASRDKGTGIFDQKIQKSNTTEILKTQ